MIVDLASDEVQVIYTFINVFFKNGGDLDAYDPEFVVAYDSLIDKLAGK